MILCWKPLETIIKDKLGNTSIQILDPLPYPQFIHFLQHMDLIVTDSGGLQEEAPALGIPILVTRECTERVELIEHYGSLIDIQKESLSRTLHHLITDSQKMQKSPKTLFGTGDSGLRIKRILDDVL